MMGARGGEMRTSRLWENPVAQSVLPVVDGATTLRVSEEAIASVAAWMASIDAATRLLAFDLSTGRPPSHIITPRKGGRNSCSLPIQ